MNTLFKTAGMLFIIILLCSSCEKLKHTTYEIHIINKSTEYYTVEHNTLPNLDTILLPLSIDSYKCGVRIWFQGIENEVLPKLTEEEFLDKISSLKVYFLSNDNDTIYYGGFQNYCRQLSNWEYDYSEDDGYGLHEYRLILKDE